jgi:hypothetical protein
MLANKRPFGSIHTMLLLGAGPIVQPAVGDARDCIVTNKNSAVSRIWVQFVPRVSRFPVHCVDSSVCLPMPYERSQSLNILAFQYVGTFDEHGPYFGTQIALQKSNNGAPRATMLWGDFPAQALIIHSFSPLFLHKHV